MFSKTTIFAILNIVSTANGQLKDFYDGCQPTFAACPAGFFQNEACECCPEVDKECDSKYNGQFCSGTGVTQTLDVYRLPLSCQKRQAIQTDCLQKCTAFPKFLIRQDSCECCPTPGMESSTIFNGKYFDDQSKTLKFAEFPKTCPQRRQQTATCSKTCTAAEELFQPACECCPDTTKMCKYEPNTNTDFFIKFCDAKTLNFNFASIPTNCPQHQDPKMQQTYFYCEQECFLEGTYRPSGTCDCCPLVGTECKFGEKFCTNGVIDNSKIPASCTASRNLPALCQNTFCPPTYIVGQNCECCPIRFQECQDKYGGQFCDAGKIILSKIPDGCPTKDSFNTCKAPDSLIEPFVCPANTFKTIACDCCPFEGKECDPVYNGAYCNNNKADLTKIGKTCPQKLYQKDCWKSPCPIGFVTSNECECCPEAGFECDYSKYGNLFCDQAGSLLKQNIPLSCQQQKTTIFACTPERYQIQKALVGISLNKYVNSQCDICPVQGKECETDTVNEFCIVIQSYKIADLSRIPSTCPQALQIKECNSSLYTKNAKGECCPLIGKETNAVYSGRYASPDGQLIYKNIPSGCPQFAPKAGCLACQEGMFMPVDAKNCECCPYSGFECDPRYGGKYCDINGNLNISAIPEICRSKKVCDDRYYWIGSDKFTCCPFQGKECDPIYANQYCPVDLKSTPPKLGNVLDQSTVPSQCKSIANPQQMCSTIYESVNGTCCPLRGKECSVFYQSEQFCTQNQIDYSKIDYRCPQFEDICQITDFRKQTTPQFGKEIYVACCPKFASGNTGSPTNQEACKTEYGHVPNVSGGFFCSKDGTVRDDVKATCTVPETKGTASLCSALEYTPISAPNICCPKPGFECVGANSKYCTSGLPDDTKIDTNCDNSVQKLATLCGAPAAPGKFWVQTTVNTCVLCPIVGSECDSSKYLYTNEKSEYCNRFIDATNGDKFTLNIMTIPSQCPQRASGYSLAPATHFQIKQNVLCPDSVTGLTFGAFYSTWANSVFTFNPSSIPACQDLSLVSCPACGPKEVAFKTGIASPDECICCPVDLNNLRDPVYNDKYYKDDQQVNGILKEQCKRPAPTNTDGFGCPKAVACGLGWVASPASCECCPDLANYTDDWCSNVTTATKSELSDLLCASIGTNGKKKNSLDPSKIPIACTFSNDINFPKQSLIDYRERDGSSCPLPGTECDSTRLSFSYCTTPVFDEKIGLIQKLDFQKLSDTCPQKKESNVCSVNACENNYISIVNSLLPTDASQCQCCPVPNKECSEVYNGKFCKDGKIIYDSIPSGCPQFNYNQFCNPQFFDRTQTGICCPKQDTECIADFGNFFCNYDGYFIKYNFDKTKCTVPVCKSECDTYYIANGCKCCPFPGFELDPVYLGAYKGFNGAVNTPRECLTLSLFPKNPLQEISMWNEYAYMKPTKITGIPPVGTLALGSAFYGSAANFQNQIAKPTATVKQLEMVGISPKINWLTKGAVFGNESLNLLYSILSTPDGQTTATTLQTAIDGQIIAMTATNYVAYPTTIFESMGLKDQAAFVSLSQVEKRSKVMTFWFNKPLAAGSKFGQQDRFLLGETNWISNIDPTVEYILSKTVAALNQSNLPIFNLKNILETTAKLNDPSLEKFIKQNRVKMVYQLVKNSLPITSMNESWHLSNAPTIQTVGNQIDSVDKLMQYSVYWLDQKFPGIQKEDVAITGEQPPVNAARSAIYDNFIKTCKLAYGLKGQSIKDDDVEDPWIQYRMEYYMQQEINQYKLNNNLWDYTRPPLKYKIETVQLYANGFEASLSNGMINDVLDISREIEYLITNPKYKDAFPQDATLTNLWNDNVLGGILAEIGIEKQNIVQSPIANSAQISEKNALFKVAWQIYTTGRNLQEVFIPTYPQNILDTYGLTTDVIAIYSLSPQQIAIVYQNALDMKVDLEIPANADKRAADLLLAFDKNPLAVTSATLEQKAGKMALFFYQLTTKPAITQANVGVISPKPYSRYFDTSIQAEKTAINLLKITNADLRNGKYNSLSIATAIQAKLIETDLALASPTYPTKFAEAVKDTAYTGDNAAKAAYLAYYIATAELGLKARGKPAIEAYFPGTRVENIVKAKIDESDFKAIDYRVTKEISKFIYTTDTVNKFGLKGTLTKEQVAKVVFADELAQKKIIFYDQLYHNMTIVQHLQSLGVTETQLEEINLSFDQVKADSAQWNSEAIGNMLFTNRYGKICDLNAASCETGWDSPKARAEIVFPLGLSRKTALAKGYSLLEVLQLARNYKEWSNNDARVTNDLGKLYATGLIGEEAVKNLYFDGISKDINDLITLGVICKPAGSTSTSTEPIDQDNFKVCDYYTNNAYPHYLANSRADTLLAPVTNIDVIFNSFGKTLKDKFVTMLTAAAVSVNGANTVSHKDYSYEKFLAAVAQFPFFCSVEENKKDFIACEKQVVGLLTLVGANTSGFKESAIAAPSCDGSLYENSCQNWPEVETIEYHWIMKLVKDAGIAIADAIYPAWGAGALKGPVSYLDFFHTYPNTNSVGTTPGKPVFQQPKKVTDLLSTQPELNWATALFRWFKPNKVNTKETITESADTDQTKSRTYFYVEDSYLTPSFDMWMLGTIGPETEIAKMFPNSYGGLRGILRNLYESDCQKDVSTTNKAIEKATKSYEAIISTLFGNSPPTWATTNNDCSGVIGAVDNNGPIYAPIPKWDKFNRKNYYSPMVTTIEPLTYTVRNFQGTAGQCFNVHIETPFSIFEKDSYARCVALKLKSTFGAAPSLQAATNFVDETGFIYQF